MKNTFILILTLTALALGAVCVLQSRKVIEQKTQLASLLGETEQQAQQINDLKASQELAENQRRELSDQVFDLSARLQASQAAKAATTTSSAPAEPSMTPSPKSENGKGGFGNFFAKLMEDPETRKMIRDQQRVTLDQLYSPLIKQMGLSPEEAERFKDLLADQGMKGAEKATSLFGGDSSTNRTEMFGKLAEEQKSFDEQMKEFLGETRYAQYKDYQQTAGERTQLNQFRQQTAGSENALTEQQTDQLLAFMKEEKQTVAAATGLPLPGETPDAASMQTMFTGEGTEKLLQSQDTVNQRVYERARAVLSENQLAAFGRFQTNQSQMMRMGLSMARKFMSPEKTEAAPSPPTPNP